MRNFWTLFKYELHRLLVSPSTYVIGAVFTLSLGALFGLTLHSYVKLENSVPFAQMFFRCFWLPTFVVVPLITMRSFSEEYGNGTLQSVFSAPIRPSQVVLAKFFAIYLSFMALWLCSLPLFLAAGFMRSSLFLELAFIAPFNVAGGLLFIALIGAFFVAIGILASSLTGNQMVAGMATFFILLAIFIGGQFLANGASLGGLTPIGGYVESIGIFFQLDNFCNGVVDTRPVVFFLSSGALALCLSTGAVQGRVG
jgi:ABC-2 type transport system permease protein